MPTVDVVVSCPIERTFRVEQMAGMFDVPLEKKTRQEFKVELPAVDEGDWRIGAIVGPSGSGKSTVAREHFQAALVGPAKWPKEKSVLDGFPADLSIKTVVETLTAVGFSSPPSWVKPYRVLSNGERFRCDLARALLLPGRPTVAYDEFTSVVDRTVARIGSAAVAKTIRKGRVDKRFVAVTCHYDVLDWLEPDWVLDMASRRLARGCLRRRPPIKIAVAPVHRSAWVLFQRHHYLSGNIMAAATCFAAFWGDVPVGFSAWVPRLTRGRRRGDMREHRTVVLPDFQGIGIGNRLSEFCASIFRGIGGRGFSTTSHPAMIHYRSASRLWKRTRLGMASPPGRTAHYRRSLELASQSDYVGRVVSAKRITGGFEYVGPAMPRKDAEAYLTCRSARFGTSPMRRSLPELLARYPGSSVALLSRLSALPASVVRSDLASMIRAGQVERAGRGGVRDPHVYYLRRG